MRLIIFTIFALVSTNCKAQESSELFGKWHTVSMDNGVKFDYKTGQYTVSEKLKDSLNTWKSSSFTLDDYIDWAGSCSDCFYVFNSNGVYQELRGEILGSEGSYSVSPKDSIMEITLRIKEKTISKFYKYYFSGQSLILKIPSIFLREEEKIIVELEKSN